MVECRQILIRRANWDGGLQLQKRFNEERMMSSTSCSVIDAEINQFVQLASQDRAERLFSCRAEQLTLSFRIRRHAVLPSPFTNSFVANGAGLCANHPSNLLCFSIEERRTARVSPILGKAELGAVDRLNRAEDFRIYSQRHCLGATRSYS